MYYEPSRLTQAISLFLQKNEKRLCLVLCVMALIRIFVCCAAFPFFNNVDEQSHFDTVVKYARGYLPAKDNNCFDVESAVLIAQFGTPEFLNKTSGPVVSPFAKTDEERNGIANGFISIRNSEAFSPPLYYLVAGCWYNLGKLLHLQGGYLLYWIRFMNLPIFALLLWVSWCFCKSAYPESPYLRLGTVLLLTFFPQDAFYSINNDVLSPLMFTGALLLLLQLGRVESGLWSYLRAGLLVAALLLVKLSNLPALLIVSAVFAWRIRRFCADKQFARHLPHVTLFVSAALLPVVLWAGRNYYQLGDLLGTGDKIDELGWTLKPYGQMLDHPIFSLQGLCYFLGGLIRTFWNGEFVWQLARIAPPAGDSIAIATSVLFGVSGGIYYLVRENAATPERRLFNYLNIFIPVVFVLFLAVLSMRYDFGDCMYPSKDAPYLTSGRLILAALIPVLILLLRGAEFLCSLGGNRLHPLCILLPPVVSIFCMDMVAVYVCNVFSSPCNFFHLS